ncbi:hypothetical protein C8F01DRAFT_996534, partial [Mycena amicta]
SSTSNTRIERLWVEVGSQFARCWRAFFYRLENCHCLDRKNAQHLWLLHYLFLDMINEDCDEFRRTWNIKPISGEGHNKSPEVPYKAFDDYDDVHPSVLEAYYGTHGSPRQHTENGTGAGQLQDEDVPAADSDVEVDADDGESDFSEDDNEEMAAAIAEACSANLNHKPVPVPKHECPFGKDEKLMGLFSDALYKANASGFIPQGYGLLEDEWENGVYPSFEILKSGRRGGRQLRIDLPDVIWRARAELWGRGLAILNQINFMTEG